MSVTPSITLKKKTGVLLVNLGTPLSPSPKDVRPYLNQFLTDRRVITLPWLWRQLLVRCLIVPKRYRSSASTYKEIWTAEGSPLLLHTQNLQEEVQKTLEDNFVVEIAMRYQQPSIESALKRLEQANLERLVIFPLFPHYASATTGSVHQEVMRHVAQWEVIPEMHLIRDFPTHPALINAFCTVGAKYDISSYDHVLFSFHGLPQSHLKKADPHDRCLKVEHCCDNLCKVNHSCYSAQCHATAHGIAHRLDLSIEQYSICFQSRLGKDPWLQPYTSDAIQKLAKGGSKRVLVFCPAFVCDCLETTFEIGVEYAEEFVEAGGESLDLVEGLNSDPSWVEAVKRILYDHLPESLEAQPADSLAIAER